jgi:hypothetical protein
VAGSFVYVGFEHSAFAFGHESFIYKSSLESSSIAPGALISFVQKGLQYSEIEAHIHEDGTESVCDEPFSILKKHQCRPKHAKRKIFSAFDALDADYDALEIDGALILRVPIDPRDSAAAASASASVTTGASGARSMSVCILWHPHVSEVRNNKRGAAATAAADQQAQHTLLTANADGTVRIWRYKDEEGDDQEDEGERKEGDSAAAANSDAAAAAAAATKQPFQKGYVCIRTLEQPADDTAGASSAAAASSSSSTSSATAPPASTAPVSNLAAAADASSAMQDTAPAADAIAAAADPAAVAAAASSSSAASSTSATAAPSSSSDSAAAPAAAASSEDERSAKRQKLNDATAANGPGAAAAALAVTPASCGHDHGAGGSCHLDQNKTIVAVDWHVSFTFRPVLRTACMGKRCLRCWFLTEVA